MKHTFFMTCLCAVLALTACGGSDSALLEGRWEMPVTEPETGIAYSYVIELNMNAPTFDSEYGPEGQKTYGFMDFSNTRHIYHSDIDSVASLGNHLYAVYSVDYNMEMMGVDGTEIDTLRYLPDTKQLVYKDGWTFNFIPDLKPFNGEWTKSFAEGSTTVHLSLYQKIKAPDEYPYNGAACYGWIEYSGEMDNSYRIITEVERVHYNMATIHTVFPDYPEDTPQRFYISYNPVDGTLSYDDSFLSPVGKHETVSVAGTDNQEREPFGSSWKDKLLIVWGIILVILLYYLIKILMEYIFIMLGAAIVGAIAGGLILWLLMGGFDLELPLWLIITILSVTTLPAALVGLWEAFKRTGELARMPFTRAIIETTKRRLRKKYGHIVDEDGNKTEIVKVSKGLLGEEYFDTEDGKHYMDTGGGDQVREL